MDTITLVGVAAVSLLVLFFIVRYAVSAGLKKQNGVIISLLYRIAEKKGVADTDLSDINRRISEL